MHVHQDTMSELLRKNLGGEALGDEGLAVQTDMLTTNVDPVRSNSFLLWNGDGQLFRVTVEECA